MIIQSVEELRSLYDPPSQRAVRKQMSHLDLHARRFVQYSPFFVLATAGKDGRNDASPRGGEAGFVAIRDERCLLIPDARGNRRIDSLINIVETGRAGALFFIPGVDETLRVNGTADVSTREEDLEPFRGLRHFPATCIRLHVEEAFLHCAMSLMRSELWSREIGQRPVPWMNEMLKDQIGEEGPSEPQERMLERYRKDL